MREDEFRDICLTCAKDLEPVFGDGLTEHVEAALQGNSLSGQAKHMTGWISVGDLTAIGNMLIGMFSAGTAYLAVRQSAKKAAAPSPTPVPTLTFVADLPAIDRELDEAIADLGSEQQIVARQLKGEIYAWLQKRSQS